MDELKNNCTLLVNTCDSYSDCWDGFFKLLKIQWPDFDMDIVLNTESKSYSFEDLKIKTFQLCCNRRMPWGKRLVETLKRINTKYVLFALDDFYLDQPVLSEELEKCYKYMENDDRIAYFSFLPTEDANNMKSSQYPGFERRPQKGEYRLNCQFALWNREYLISYIRPHESPWEWELYGSRRSARYTQEFYTISHDAPPIFSYKNGEVIMRGRWYLSRVEPLIKKYDLKVDLTKREKYEDYVSNKHKHKRSLLRGIKNRINKIKSII